MVSHWCPICDRTSCTGHEEEVELTLAEEIEPSKVPGESERMFPSDPRGALDAGAVKATGFVRDEDGRWPARRSR